MPDLYKASINDKLWHAMRQDLAGFVPEIASNNLLMCCACGRFLPREYFDLEHLVPQQAVKHDPPQVRANPETPVNVRSRNQLLCKKELRFKGAVANGRGCNSWKGRFYDARLRELVLGDGFKPDKTSERHIIAAVSLAYLAMVAEYGYIVTLMETGLILRQQFFMPDNFHPALPLNSQMLLGLDKPIMDPNVPIWGAPFSFGFTTPGFCTVAMRNFVVSVPIARDPRVTVAKHLRIAPAKYKLKPNFSTFFD